MLTLTREGIKVGVEKSQALSTIDHKFTSEILPGQVVVVNQDGTVSKANATTSKADRCLVATEKFNISVGNAINGSNVEFLYTHTEDRYAFKFCLNKGSANFVAFTQADVGKICGLNAAGNMLDKSNATQLVEITKVSPTTFSNDVQRVYFRFL